MRRSRFLAVALFLIGAVAVIEAQQPRPGGRGGFGFRDVATMVATNEDLQKELKVTDAQKEKLKAINEKQREELGKLFKGGFDKDRIDEIRKESAKVSEETRKAIDETLTADQKKRIKEIQLQVDGVRAFAEEPVADELKLTDTQKDKIRSISEDYGKDIRELSGFGGGRGKGGFKGGFDKEKLAENAKKREKLTKAAMADIDDVLTDEQRSKWKQMVGAPFDTSKLNTGFGGRGFGGFGGGQGKGKGRPKDE